MWNICSAIIIKACEPTFATEVSCHGFPLSSLYAPMSKLTFLGSGSALNLASKANGPPTLIGWSVEKREWLSPLFAFLMAIS